MVNNTGYTIEVQYAEHIIILDQYKNQFTKKQQNKWVKIDNSESIPLNIIQSGSSESLKEHSSQKHMHKYLNYKIIHPEWESRVNSYNQIMQTSCQK